MFKRRSSVRGDCSMRHRDRRCAETGGTSLERSPRHRRTRTHSAVTPVLPRPLRFIDINRTPADGRTASGAVEAAVSPPPPPMPMTEQDPSAAESGGAAAARSVEHTHTHRHTHGFPQPQVMTQTLPLTQAAPTSPFPAQIQIKVDIRDKHDRSLTLIGPDQEPL